MALLKDTRTGPPGGWRYVQPETGCEVVALSAPELVERVMQHRAFKGIEPKDWESVIVDVQRQLCSKLEPRFCRPEPGETYAPIVDEPGGMTISKVTAGTRAFMAFLAGGGAVVEKSTSEARAKTCRGCVYNRNADGCGACSVLYATIEAVIPRSRTEPGLKACAICGCVLRAKVLMPRVVLEASDAGRNLTYPPHCWQNGENHE